tara:strand:+ start:611 stop:1072 length:462 start_codon:yes stop_codon:yes gene_type:complete
MKQYKNKQELINDIIITENIGMEYKDTLHLIYEIYQRWYETSPDSFKYVIISDQCILQKYVDLLNNIHLYYSDRHQEKYKLFLKWKEEGTDSPWYKQDIQAANTLLSISGEGSSNQWEGEHTIFVDIDSKKVKAKRKKVTFSPNARYNLRSRC